MASGCRPSTPLRLTSLGFSFTVTLMISLIVAASENNVIGRDNAIPWRLPDDWKNFKETTMGCPLIMGRKTFESIGRPLPGRRNIIVTRQRELKIEGCDVVGSLEEAIDLAKSESPREIFIGGGEEIYRLALPLADRVYLTRVHTTIDGTVHFPELGEEWKEMDRRGHPADEKHPYAFTFLTFEKSPRP
jgi:dihydrofolate reductase